MSLLKYMGRGAILLATWSFILPLHLVVGAEQQGPGTIIRDIALQAGGALEGQFVDAQGQPAVGDVVQVKHVQTGTATTVRTDAHGRFRLTNLRGGLYQVTAGTSTMVCRLWREGTSPPVASQLLLVKGDRIERGQRPFCDALTNPLVIGLVIAAAIAIPIAVHNSRGGGAPTPGS